MSKLRNRPNSSPNYSLSLVSKPNLHFISEIQRISRHNRRACCSMTPLIAGQPVDLQKLYNEVAARGGHKRVTSAHAWSEVYAALGLPFGCVESGHGLRTIYQRYLELYERNQRMASRGPFPNDDLDASSLLDTDSQDVDGMCKLPKTSKVYGASDTDAIPSHLREIWNLSTSLAERKEYSNLEHALKSHLPNEVDFALNAMLLMSYQSDDFGLHKNIHLLTLLLQSVGIFESIPQVELVETITYARFNDFWNTTVFDDHGRVFLLPKIFATSFYSPPSASTVNCARLLRTHDLAYSDDEGFRVQLVATILRNLAVEGGLNAVTIGRDPQALRFIFLCIYANHSNLRQLGLETLSSLHFPVTGALFPSLRHLVHTLMSSDDRNDRMRGLLLLRRLCEFPVYLSLCDQAEGKPYVQCSRVIRNRPILTTDRNVDFLLSLAPVVLHSVVSTLCIRDLHLVILALDALYSLSSLGPALCERLLQTPVTESAHPSSSAQSSTTGLSSFLTILISMVRLEARSLGSESLIRVSFAQTPDPNASEHSKLTSAAQKPSAVVHPSTHLGVCAMMSVTPGPVSGSTQPQANTLTADSANSLQVLPRPTSSSVHPLQSTIVSKDSIRPTAMLHAQTLILPRPLATTLASSTNQISNLTDAVSSGLNCAITTTPTSQPKISESIIFTTTASHSVCTTTGSKGDTKMHSCLSASSVEPNVNLSALDPRSSVTAHTYSMPPLRPRAPKVVSTIGTVKRSLTPDQTLVLDTSERSDTPNRSGVDRLPNIPSKLLPLKPLKLISTPTSSVSTSVARRDYMLGWLRKNYAIHHCSSISRAQIYADYQQAHRSRFGHNHVSAISPSVFHSEIKSIFPGVEQVKLLTTSGNVEIHYNNLKHVHTTEFHYEQGINNIMSAVLTASVTESESLSISQTKPSKRTIASLLQESMSPSLVVDQIVSDSVKNETSAPVKMARKILELTPNGHTPQSELLNGQGPLNGLNKDVALVFSTSNSLDTKSTSLSNGDLAKLLPVCTNTVNLTRFPHYPKLNELVSGETNVVLLPVFATLNLHSTSTHVRMHGLSPAMHTNSLKYPGLAVCLSTVTHNTRTTSVPPTVATALKPDCGASKSAETLVSASDETTPGVIMRNDETPITTVASPTTHQPASASPAACCQNPIVVSCQWAMCDKTFLSANELSIHVCDFHLASSEPEVTCRWSDCVQHGSAFSADALRTHVTGVHLSLSNSHESSTSHSTVPLNDTNVPETCSLSTLLQTDCLLLDDLESPILIPSPSETDKISQASGDTVTETKASPSLPNLSVNSILACTEPNIVTVSHCQSSSQYPDLCTVPELSDTQSESGACDNTESTSTHSRDNSKSPCETVVIEHTQRCIWSPPLQLSEECRKALDSSTLNPSFTSMSVSEGPITKHIRLTAALILKNLLRYNHGARRYVTVWEQLLCELAFSSMDSAPILFECLTYLNQTESRGAALPHFLSTPVRHSVNFNLQPSAI